MQCSLVVLVEVSWGKAARWEIRRARDFDAVRMAAFERKF